VHRFAKSALRLLPLFFHETGRILIGTRGSFVRMRVALTRIGWEFGLDRQLRRVVFMGNFGM